MIVSEAEAEQLNATPEGEAGEMGLHPIGPGCLQAHPEIRPYVQWQVKKRPEAEGKLLPPNQKGADV